jgi:hypothetical protein
MKNETSHQLEANDYAIISLPGQEEVPGKGGQSLLAPELSVPRTTAIAVTYPTVFARLMQSLDRSGAQGHIGLFGSQPWASNDRE